MSSWLESLSLALVLASALAESRCVASAAVAAVPEDCLDPVIVPGTAGWVIPTIPWVVTVYEEVPDVELFLAEC